jgi:hypothetical protein
MLWEGEVVQNSRMRVGKYGKEVKQVFPKNDHDHT